MTIFGLSDDYYLVNNPIYVNITGLQGFTNLNLRLSNDINLNFPIFNNTVTFDISPVVKSMMKRPSFSDDLVAQPNQNIIVLSFEFWPGNNGTYDQNDMRQLIGKRFIRGGQFTGRNNHLANHNVLKVSERIPMWQSYPVFSYKIDGNSIVKFQPDPIGSSTEKPDGELRRVHGCNNAYLAFLNSLGGYSYWLFENASISTKYKNAETMDNFESQRPMNHFSSLGDDMSHSLLVEGNVPKRYFRLMHSLSISTDVWLYEPNKLLGENFVPWVTDDWIKIHNSGNGFDINLNRDAQKVSFNFDMKLTHNNKITW